MTEITFVAHEEHCDLVAYRDTANRVWVLQMSMAYAPPLHTWHKADDSVSVQDLEQARIGYLRKRLEPNPPPIPTPVSWKGVW